MSAPVESGQDAIVVAERPKPGTPRRYHFPAVTSQRLANGLSILVIDLPGRPLVSASLVVSGGAAEEPPEQGGAVVLAARALTEGTERHDAISLVEATERLGASLHADAGWDALSVNVDVAAARLGPALELVAEVLLTPTFPEPEVERLRDERLNDLLQARADPRRRVEEAFVGTIYAPQSPYHRPSGGTRETVETLGAGDLRRVYERTIAPDRATLVVGGDLGGQDVVALAERLFGSWAGGASHGSAGPPVVDAGGSGGRIVRVVHRPGSVQTEIRIGHRGLPRRIPDFHAVSLMSAILGGLFNSRLNMKLREEKGYTYGAGAGFDMRRGAGPFAARAAVNTEVTVPAILDTLAELTRMRDEAVSESELVAARDFLIGVFPLRFETAGAVVGALGSLAVHGLGVEELVGYRGNIESLDVSAISAAAAAHLHVDEAAIVLVGDADAFGADLEAAGLGPIVIERDDEPAAAGPVDDEAQRRPVDDGAETGPAAGAQKPVIPGLDEAPPEPDDGDQETARP
ncbi:MAG: zinc protease [Chloroflexota bacterium]|nr:zinc protease [Chloroflexota bacterium]